MSGLGQRLLQVAQGIATHCDVRVLSAAAGSFDAKALPVEVAPLGPAPLSWPDALYCADNVPASLVRAANRQGLTIFAENHTPIEHLYYRVGNVAERNRLHRAAIATYRAQLDMADKFIVRCEAERIAVIDGLVLAGRIDGRTLALDPSLAGLVDVVPIGILSSEVTPLAHDRLKKIPVVIWNGGIYEFHDPAYLVDASADLARAGRLSLAFPFVPREPSLIMSSLIDTIERHALSSVVALGDVDASKRSLTEDPVLLACVGRKNVENAVCQRLRTREIFAYDAPIIVDGYGATGQWVKSTGVGIALDPELDRAREQLAELASAKGRVAHTRAIARHRPSVLLDSVLERLGEDIGRRVHTKSLHRNAFVPSRPPQTSGSR